MASLVTTGVGLVLATMVVAGECRAGTDSFEWMDSVAPDVGRCLLNHVPESPGFAHVALEVVVTVDDAHPTVMSYASDSGKAPSANPSPTRGADTKETFTPHQEKRNYRRAASRQPLKDLVGLPTAIAEDLNALVRLASTVTNVTPDTNTEGCQVKYFTGVTHSHHGLLEDGVNEASGPPAGIFVSEHCFDTDGRLVKVIEHREDGSRSVSRTFLYTNDLPVGMLTFGPNGFCFGDYGLYREGRLRLVARIDPTGNIMSCECISYAGDREDYTARYLVKRTGGRFSTSDLQLHALHLNGP